VSLITRVITRLTVYEEWSNLGALRAGARKPVIRVAPVVLLVALTGACGSSGTTTKPPTKAVVDAQARTLYARQLVEVRWRATVDAISVASLLTGAESMKRMTVPARFEARHDKIVEDLTSAAKLPSGSDRTLAARRAGASLLMLAKAADPHVDLSPPPIG
jgi:hypothetical protein